MDDIGEPCDTCKRGIAKFVCFDNVRRCQKCIAKLVAENLWNLIVLPPAPKKKRVKSGGPMSGQETMF